MSRIALLHNSMQNWGLALELSAGGSINGSGLVGVTLTCVPPSYTYDGIPVTPSVLYQWYADGIAISGATANTYTLTASEDTKLISCQTVSTFQGKTDAQTINGPTVSTPSGGSMDPAPPPPSNLTSTGRITLPFNATNSTVQGYAAGTDFWLPNGTYNNLKDVRPKDGMTFVGESQNGVILNGSGEAYAFRGKTSNVVIARMTIQNYNGLGDNESELYRQDHAVIMGKESGYYLGSADAARDWHIYQVILKDNGNVGIYMGHRFTVHECDFYRMSPYGLGGGRFTGGNVHTCYFEDNGIYGASGFAVNNSQIKITWLNVGPFGQADRDSSVWTTFTQNPPPGAYLADQTETPEPFKLTNCTFECKDNCRAIWFDLDCRDSEVSYCTINDSNNFGIFHEGSNYGLIHHNTFNRCGNLGAFDYNRTGGAFNSAYYSYAAICSGSSDNIIVEDNIIDDCEMGIVFFLGERGRNGGDWTNGHGFPVADTAMRYMLRNTFTPASIGERATTGASTCAARRNTFSGTTRYMGYLLQSPINYSTEANPTTYVFEDNIYSSTQTTGSYFLWNKQFESYAQWQSGGRN